MALQCHTHTEEKPWNHDDTEHARTLVEKESVIKNDLAKAKSEGNVVSDKLHSLLLPLPKITRSAPPPSKIGQFI